MARWQRSHQAANWRRSRTSETVQSDRYCQPLPNDSSLLSCAEQMLYEPEATPRFVYVLVPSETITSQCTVPEPWSCAEAS